MNPSSPVHRIAEPAAFTATDARSALPARLRAAQQLLGPLDTLTLAALLTQTPRDIEAALGQIASATDFATEAAANPTPVDEDLLTRAVRLFLNSGQTIRAAELLLSHGRPDMQLDLLESAGWWLFYSPARALVGKFLALNQLHPRLQEGELLGLRFIWTIEVAGEPHSVERVLQAAPGLSPALRATLQARIAQMFDQAPRAISQAKIAVEAFPNDLSPPALLARYTLGLALLEAGRPQESIAPLSAALKGASRDKATLLQIDALQALAEQHVQQDLPAPAQLYAQEAQRLRQEHGLRPLDAPWPEQDYLAFPQLLEQAMQALAEGRTEAAASVLRDLEARERKTFYCFKWRNRLLHAQTWLAAQRHELPALLSLAEAGAARPAETASLYELERLVLQAGAALLAARPWPTERLQVLGAELQARPLALLWRRLQLIQALGSPAPDLLALRQWLDEEEPSEMDVLWLAPKLIGPLNALLSTPAIVHHRRARDHANDLLHLLQLEAPAAADKPAAPDNGDEANPSPDVPPLGLTLREWQVLRLIGEPLSNEQIAAQLFVSVATVKTHINRAYSKLGLGSRAEAVQLVRRRR
ncbi:LuxR C-terminal-related transcriptional regulator [Paucibacter sp. AS339]|uniref:helix-turn-helix transcriptional regulator n=1 Tax=Paucibacter hankyongi TaxID=3133434 RepID=UPI0030AA92A8